MGGDGCRRAQYCVRLLNPLFNYCFAEPQTNSLRKFPKITLRLRAPIELENLLPYNIEYRIYDKDADQNWRSYLRKGGIMPIHSVELRHLVLLNINVQDTGGFTI